MNYLVKSFSIILVSIIMCQWSWGQKLKTTGHILYKYNNENYTIRIDSISQAIQLGTSKEFIEYTFEKDTFYGEIHKAKSLFKHEIFPSIKFLAKRFKPKKKYNKNTTLFATKLKRNILFIQELEKNTFFAVTTAPFKNEIFKKYLLGYIISSKEEKLNIELSTVFRAKTCLHVIQHNFFGKFLFVEIRGKKKKCILVTTLRKT